MTFGEDRKRDLVCFIGWKPFLSTDHCSAMECRIRGGMTVVLGEMEGARVKPKPMLLGRPLSS